MRRLILLALLAGPGCAGEPPAARNAVQEALRPADLDASEARGRALFATRCAPCHGPEGRGDGQNAFNLDPAPPDLGESLDRLSSDDRRRVIVGGTAALGRSPLCPPHGPVLRPEGVEDLVAYLGVLAELEAPAEDGGFPGRRRSRPPAR